MIKEFERFKEWLSLNFREGLDDLNPPATDEEIEALTQGLGFTPPEDLVSLLKIHNGQKGDAGWIFEGQEFLSSERILDEWSVWNGLLESGDFDECASEPQKGIKDSWWNKKWIPFTYNGCGDHYCVDMDPANEGFSGQIITMWHDAGEREFLASSLSDWFKAYVEKLMSGELVYSDEYEAIVNKNDI